jgi:AcrR family transcriptional regulator
VTRGSAETRSLLIHTALELFATRGLDNVSMREIGVAAGQGNNAAVQYYFGDRDGLLKAIIEELSQTNVALAESTGQHFPPNAPASPRELASALVLPLASMLDDRGLYLEFIALVMIDPPRATLLVQEPAAGWFRDVEQRVARDLGFGWTDHRFTFAVTLTVHALADRARLERSQHDPPPRDNFVDDLIDAVAALLSSRARPTRAADARRR